MRNPIKRILLLEMTEKRDETSDSSSYETISESDDFDENNSTLNLAKIDPIDELIGAVTRCQLQYSMMSKDAWVIYKRATFLAITHIDRVWQ